jgi:hypothetical protein
MEMRGDGRVECKARGPKRAGESAVWQGDISLGSGIANNVIVPHRMIVNSSAWRSNPAAVSAQEEAVAAV